MSVLGIFASSAGGRIYAQPNCSAAPLSDQKIREAVERARATRTDLPPQFPQFRFTVRRQGCHYLYMEYGLPETPEYTNIFRLNQHGVVVDAENANLKCPEKVFAESELAEIVGKERIQRRLPPSFPRIRVRVDRLRCLYMYFEYAVPESRGNYWVFTVDPFGEVMDVQRPDPY